MAISAASDMVEPSPAELFTGFLKLSVVAFGGVLPWAHQVLVEERRWLSHEEFTNTLGLCQFLPGPNILNVAIAVGARFHGVRGSLAASLGLCSAPFLIVICLALTYARFGDLPLLRAGIDGVAAAAAGLVVAVALRLAIPLLRARPVTAVPFLLLAFLAVGVLRLPLLWTLLVLVPGSIIAVWAWERRR